MAVATLNGHHQNFQSGDFNLGQKWPHSITVLLNPLSLLNALTLLNLLTPLSFLSLRNLLNPLTILNPLTVPAQVLKELESVSPSKEEYSQLCLLLTLNKLSEHPEYR